MTSPLSIIGMNRKFYNYIKVVVIWITDQYSIIDRIVGIEDRNISKSNMPYHLDITYAGNLLSSMPIRIITIWISLSRLKVKVHVDNSYEARVNEET
ncbi:unnamed protein product [Rotaria sp. Silwood1]|nr:unnamed protein product [Rotaria sp. Silwood1]CAF1411275.1 unnamed protein product [Rotaria sp. Silwood1]